MPHAENWFLGGSGSGKDHPAVSRIRTRAEAGWGQHPAGAGAVHVTSSTEARIYRELGDALSGMVESYSFTSLAEHIPLR